MAAGKATYHRVDPTEVGEEGAEGLEGAVGDEAAAGGVELTALTGELATEAVAEGEAQQPEAGE